MHKKALLLIVILLHVSFLMMAQQASTGQVYDAATGERLPFATIKFGDSGKGEVAGLDGTFAIPTGNWSWIEVSCLGYIPQKITFPASKTDIYLKPAVNNLNEVAIAPPYEKIRRILNNAIANKNENNPDKYDWYRCHVYYKMIVDLDSPHIVNLNRDKNPFSNKNKKTTREQDSIKRKRFYDFIENEHLLMSETYSIRTWEKPQKLQEDVLASRFSGLKKSMFTSLVTDVLPFHAYTDYFTLNGKDYHNPVSRGYNEYYRFNLEDEILQGDDTVWILSFRPKGHNANELRGTVYINSSGYAISQIIAKANDTMLKMNVRIEQQYEQLPVTATEKKWFPKHLNYVIDFTQQTSRGEFTYHMKGYSRIDSVTWNKDEDFHFDKTHTVKLAPNADELSDSTWQTVRPDTLDKKEKLTYKVIDSLGEKIHMDKKMTYLSKIPEGKVPIGILDFDLKRLFNWNEYEGTRLGLGVQTNEHLIRWLSVGGWAGYGFNDAHWKYGAFAEFYADRAREFVFKVTYTDDINDPGRIRMNNELDKNYLNAYLLQRVDETKTFSASVKKKLGYWTLELAGRQQQIDPKYQYALLYNGTDYKTFTASEASLTFRYAFAERTAPYFGYYYSLGSRYPIWYGKITSGSISGGAGMDVPYTQAVTAVLWHKHINRIGMENFLIEGGKSWSNGPLPLSKLFAGNGYNYDASSSVSFYTFGGLLTMLPYQYYSDQFASLIYRHDFDWKLYKVEIPDTKFSSAPNICLQYNMLYGSLSNQQAQQYVNFSVPSNGYYEGGILLNNLARLIYANLYYITFNVGYFYHFTSVANLSTDSRIVVGVGFEL